MHNIFSNDTHSDKTNQSSTSAILFDITVTAAVNRRPNLTAAPKQGVNESAVDNQGVLLFFFSREFQTAWASITRPSISCFDDQLTFATSYSLDVVQSENFREKINAKFLGVIRQLRNGVI